MDYQASSPDEKALVEACAKMGLVFVGDDADVLHIKLRESCVKRNVKSVYGEVPREELVKYQRLAVLEFTSDRKRMSVIVKDAQGLIWVYTKGAESHVLPLCTKTSSGLVISTQRHINEFAKQGLRTLAVARRRLTQVEYSNFRNELMQANSSLTGRIAKVSGGLMILVDKFMNWRIFMGRWKNVNGRSKRGWSFWVPRPWRTHSRTTSETLWSPCGRLESRCGFSPVTR